MNEKHALLNKITVKRGGNLDMNEKQQQQKGRGGELEEERQEEEEEK